MNWLSRFFNSPAEDTQREVKPTPKPIELRPFVKTLVACLEVGDFKEGAVMFGFEYAFALADDLKASLRPRFSRPDDQFWGLRVEGQEVPLTQAEHDALDAAIKCVWRKRQQEADKLLGAGLAKIASYIPRKPDAAR